MSSFDANSCIRKAFDDTTEKLNVNATVTASIGEVECIIDQASDSIRIGDGTTLTTVTTVGPKSGLDVNIINTNIPLPLGAALESKQDTGNTSLASIDSKLISTIAGIKVDIGTSIPLAADAATASNQLLGNSTLTSIDSKITTTVNGIKVDAIGAATEIKQDTQITELQAIKTAVQNIDAGIPSSLGPQLSAQSLSVTLASDQTALTIEDPITTRGSIDGTIGGTKYNFVYNLRQQILATHDRQENYTYADFGTKDQRITRVDYTSATFPGITIRRDLNYTLTSGKYKRTDTVWTVV
jgi:hypothetical protein